MRGKAMWCVVPGPLTRRSWTNLVGLTICRPQHDQQHALVVTYSLRQPGCYSFA